MLKPEQIHKLALLMPGGIGDLLLFSPVIAEIRGWLPKTHITLLLEDRSAGVLPLLPIVDANVELHIQGRNRRALFFELSSLLRRKFFDVVVAGGASPFMAPMLFTAQVPVRVGYNASPASRSFLTIPAPYDPDRYAAEMHMALATSLLTGLFGPAYQPREADHVRPVIQPPDDISRIRARDALGLLLPAKTVLVHPGTGSVARTKGIEKNWSPTRWANLIRALTESGVNTYLVGGPDDAEVIGEILRYLPAALPHFADVRKSCRNLSDLAALMDAVDVVVCADSSPMHVSVALDRPTVALFGPTDQKKLLPHDVPHLRPVSRDTLSCRPCLWHARQTSCANPVCLNVEVDAMLQEILFLLR